MGTSNRTSQTLERPRKRTTIQWSSGTNLLSGLWLLAAPFVLGYSDVGAALSNDLIVGIVVMTLAAIRAARPAQGPGMSWTNALLGAWLVIAPFLLGYGDLGAAVANDIIVGLVVLTVGSVSALATRGLHRTTQ